LASTPVAIGPANDGGYYLIGLCRMIPELFQGVAWSQSTVLSNSLAVLAKAGLKPALLPALDDLDRPEDLAAWPKIIELEEADLAQISVIVPALNEAKHILQTVQAARRGGAHEIIVIDGGSSDHTKDLARQTGATVLDSPPGRARQMNAGAASATGASLVFLHADTLLPENWRQVVSAALQRPGVAAGAFHLRIAQDFRGKWLILWAANLRSTWLQRPYGDQALFLRRSVFEETGGFADLPIMEDYELVSRLRRKGRVLTVTESVLTSGRRWQRLGAFRTTWMNQRVLLSYHLGLSLTTAAKRYRGT
jgi:rSAM/selenodomain-associated transferase 2